MLRQPLPIIAAMLIITAVLIPRAMVTDTSVELNDEQTRVRAYSTTFGSKERAWVGVIVRGNV